MTTTGLFGGFNFQRTHQISRGITALARQALDGLMSSWRQHDGRGCQRPKRCIPRRRSTFLFLWICSRRRVLRPRWGPSVTDNRSEWPDFINALRFNLTRMCSSCTGGLPFVFQALCVLAGVQWAAVSLLVLAGLGSLPCVALVLSFCLLLLQERTLLNTQPTLRENFGAPFMWLQLALVLWALSLDVSSRTRPA